MTLFPILAAAHPENEAYASLASIGSAMYGSALATGLLLFGLGLWWLFLAVVTVSTHYVTYDIAFNVSFYHTVLLCPCLRMFIRWVHGA